MEDEAPRSAATSILHRFRINLGANHKPLGPERDQSGVPVAASGHHAVSNQDADKKKTTFLRAASGHLWWFLSRLFMRHWRNTWSPIQVKALANGWSEPHRSRVHNASSEEDGSQEEEEEEEEEGEEEGEEGEESSEGETKEEAAC
jgi:hypothetical protein